MKSEMHQLRCFGKSIEAKVSFFGFFGFRNSLLTFRISQSSRFAVHPFDIEVNAAVLVLCQPKKGADCAVERCSLFEVCLSS